MRRFLKFLHTIGAIGFMGAMASLLVLLSVAPPPTSLAGYALMRGAMAAIATWIFLPALALTLVAGLFATALNNAYLNAGWAWVKAATGVLIFEGFVRVQGSMQEEAERSARALAGQIDPATLGGSLGAERITLWVVLAVATANVVLGIWRPRLTRLPGQLFHRLFRGIMHDPARQVFVLPTLSASAASSFMVAEAARVRKLGAAGNGLVCGPAIFLAGEDANYIVAQISYIDSGNWMS